MSERFYVSSPLAPGEMHLAGPEAHHLAAVCRARPGDAICLFNGDGHQYPARICQVERRAVIVEVLAVETPQRELGFHLEVAAPLPKGDRGQFLIEKLTELGVTVFTPLQTRRSVVHPREARLDKLGRWVIEASKQCGRNFLMAVSPLADWETYCARADLPERKWLAHPGLEEVSACSLKSQPTALAAGPEGGFTEEEVACALAAGWQGVGLGPRILRVETAAIVLATKVIYDNS